LDCLSILRLLITVAVVETMLSEPDRRAAGDWGVELPPNVTFPVNYTISMKRVFELARQALERYPMLEAQALRVLWMSRYEEAWD
jgi:hypothetical protein